MATPSEIEEVRRRADIVDVIGSYVALKRAGSVFKGLCPFHNEKTPSFQVNPARGLWYCFGQCSEGGDVFKFVQRVENLSFREALERLAQRYNVILTNEFAKAEPPGQRDRLLKAAELATVYYEETLRNGEVAKAYLERRGLGYEIQKAFRIGYAGEDSEGVFRYLRRNGVTSEDAVEAGIVLAGDRGTFRDKLWQRIVFPIVDVQDRPIAFGGRLMESIEGRPKYLNSAETPQFHKSRTLYGLSRARKAIVASDQAIVVEGYMDVVACHQAGFENVIATLGTALTEDHANILKRYASRVLLAFDSDAAGMKAARKSDAIFKNVEMETRILAMPDGEDPDSVLRNGQRALLELAIKNALPVTEFHLRKLMDSVDLSSMSEDDRLGIFRREVVPLIKGTTSVMERERYIRIVAPLHPHYQSGAAFAEEQIREEIDGRLPQLPQRPQQGRGNWQPNGNKEYKDRQFKRYDQPRPQEPHVAPPRGIETAELVIVRALLEGNGEATEIIINEIQAEDFVKPAGWKLTALIIAGMKPADALRKLEKDDPEVYESLIRIAAADDGTMTTMKGESLPIDAEMVRGCIGELRDRRLDIYESDLRSRANAGDLEAQIELPKFIRQRKGSRAA
ncbi:MAG TPA: DNA primase [Capsulimonadaceae bacterium]|jgi:DNA primase catalytic core